MDKFLSSLGITKSVQITYKDAVRIKHIEPPIPNVPPRNYLERMLRRLMLTDIQCRQLPAVDDSIYSVPGDAFSDAEDEEEVGRIHPMDVLSYLYLTAHPLLRQSLSLQLSKCQLSVPLVIPDPHDSTPIYFQFALSPIIKNHLSDTTPVSLSVCSELLPVVSFLRVGRIGRSEHSKSQLLNQVFENRSECFFSRTHASSVKNRVLFNGSIEAAWYLPSREMSEDLCSTPVTFLNLRGDALLYPSQRSLLSSVSTLVFVFISMKDLLDRELEQLRTIYSQCDSSKVVLVLVTQDKAKAELYKISLPDPYSSMRLQVAVGQNTVNLQSRIRQGLRDKDARTSLNLIQEEAKRLGMRLDSAQIPHSSIQAVCELTPILYTDTIGNSLPLQHTGWYKWCQAQRELHTMYAVSENVGELSDRISETCRAARREQCDVITQDRAPFILKFLSYCNQFSTQLDEFEYLWKILITHINTNKRVHSKFPTVPHAVFSTSQPLELLSSLQRDQLGQSAEDISVASVSRATPCIHAEHILRELAQLFEMYDSSTALNKKQLDALLPCSPALLPQLAAELLLRGHSLELLDGEVNHVPTRWVKRVLEALAAKVGRDKTLFVLAVVGVQSSGKSTLLNTMFGQHLAVSSARCTRGVLMQLVSVITPKAGFDYIVLLDTEGLSNPQLDPETMRNHDNELATFVVGLSDLTIVNISMEAINEVKNILQITVLALIRMQLTYSKPKCIFVHQNVTDVMAPVNLQETRDNFVAFLNENTRAAVIHRHHTDKLTNFNDVIDFDSTNDVWYFPGYLEGRQAMAWVSENYSRCAERLKHYILKSNQGQRSQFQTIGQWALKLENIWRCVLKEDFVFHYTNVKEINDHFELDSVLAGWSFQFSNEISRWASDAINRLSNCGSQEVAQVWNKIQGEIPDVCQSTLYEEQKQIVEEYFESAQKKPSFLKWKNVTLELFSRIRTKEQQRVETDCFHFQAAQLKLQHIKHYFEETKRFLSDKVKELFEQIKTEDRSFENPGVICEIFEEEWEKWIAKVVPNTPINCPIGTDIQSDIRNVILTTPCLQAIQRDEKISLLESVKDYTQVSEIEFGLGEHHFSVNNNINGLIQMIQRPYVTFFQVLESLKVSSGYFQSSPPESEDINYTRALRYAETLSDKCQEFVSDLPANSNYNKSYLTSLVELVATETKKINFEEQSSAETSIEFSNLFILEFSFYQCCRALRPLKKLQDSFFEKTNPEVQLKLLKEELKSIFTSLCDGIQKEDHSSFLLASLLMEGIQKALVDTVQRVAVLKFTQEPEHENIYKTRQLLHLQILKDLAKTKLFHNYIQYIQQPLVYMEDWIKKNLEDFCTMESTIERIKREVLDPVLREKLGLICESGVAAIPGSDWNGWKTEFHGKISTCVRDIDADTLSRIDTYAVTNLSQFCEFLTHHLSRLADQFDWISWIRSLMVRGLPSKTLVSNLLECRALCPFCREPCQRGGTSHQHYCGSFHRPKGIGGCYHNVVNTLSISECTSSVGSNKNFWYGNRSYPYADYRKVNDMFASWRILPEDAVESRYWQWVLFHFHEQFCAKYGYAPNNLVNNWSNLTEEDVVEDLERHYQNYCFRMK